MSNITKAIAGHRNATSRTVIKSGATQFTMNKRTKTDVMKLFYGTIAEYSLAKGALKPTKIPADIVEAYAPKK